LNEKTLRNWYHGKTKSYHDAAAECQLLLPAAENTLIDWITHEGAPGTPLNCTHLKAHASAIAGQPIGKNWVVKFQSFHLDLVKGKAQKLDPKQANNFNKATYNDFADKYASIHAAYQEGIPPEHIYNMDEKGIQMGGGQKKGNKVYFYLRSQVN
jgi:hypothetical protein